MLKMMVILAVAIAFASCSADHEEEKNSFKLFMLDLRAQVKRLTSKVEGINTRIGNVECKVNDFTARLEPKVDGLSEKLQGISHDVESVKNGYTGDPFSACTGQVITVTSTAIKYPLTGNYGRGDDCKWIVKAGDNVKISFTYVEILQNGHSKGKWLGHSVPSDELVLNGEFTVHFKSDGIHEYKGFRMEINRNE